MKWTRRQEVRAWFDKHILHIMSPTAKANGFDYMWDMMRTLKRGRKHVEIISATMGDGTSIIVNGMCAFCGNKLEEGRLFMCEECQKKEDDLCENRRYVQRDKY